jgi:hypothetical protein
VFTKESTTIEFSLSAQIDSVGWVGMGIGGQAGGMAGNDLAVSIVANTRICKLLCGQCQRPSTLQQYGRGHKHMLNMSFHYIHNN